MFILSYTWATNAGVLNATLTVRTEVEKEVVCSFRIAIKEKASL